MSAIRRVGSIHYDDNGNKVYCGWHFEGFSSNRDALRAADDCIGWRKEVSQHYSMKLVLLIAAFLFGLFVGRLLS